MKPEIGGQIVNSRSMRGVITRTRWFPTNERQTSSQYSLAQRRGTWYLRIYLTAVVCVAPECSCRITIE